MALERLSALRKVKGRTCHSNSSAQLCVCERGGKVNFSFSSDSGVGLATHPKTKEGDALDGPADPVTLFFAFSKHLNGIRI